MCLTVKKLWIFVGVICILFTHGWLVHGLNIDCETSGLEFRFRGEHRELRCACRSNFGRGFLDIENLKELFHIPCLYYFNILYSFQYHPRFLQMKLLEKNFSAKYLTHTFFLQYNQTHRRSLTSSLGNVKPSRSLLTWRGLLQWPPS